MTTEKFVAITAGICLNRLNRIKRTADTLKCTKWIDFRLNSHKITLDKAEILLMRTLTFAPMLFALDRFHCYYNCCVPGDLHLRLLVTRNDQAILGQTSCKILKHLLP